MKTFGLPTYPISDGMELGERASDEVDWLLQHGVLISHLRGYRQLIKSNPQTYQLIRMTAVPTSCEAGADEVIDSTCDLQALVDKHDLHIAGWRWHAITGTNVRRGE